jgi:hypothetical protein
MNLYIATARVETPLSGTEKLILHETMAQSKVANGSGEKQFDFVVPTSTTALSFFIQSQNAGATQKSTVVNPGDAGVQFPVPITLFKNYLPGKDGGNAGNPAPIAPDDLSIRSLQVTYANQNKPPSRYTNIDGNETTSLQQRYMDTHSASLGLHTITGPESFETFKRLGGLYHYEFSKPLSDRSTHVNLQLNLVDGNGNYNVFCVAHYSRSVQITSQNGYITNVLSITD